MGILELTTEPALQERIRSTIRLLHNGIEHIRDAPQGDARADKAACEVALFLWGLNRNGFSDTDLNESIQSLITLVEQRLRSPSIIQGLLWKPERVSMLCMGTALLNGLGRRNDKFDEIAISAWRKLFLDSSERSPFQLMEVEWSANLFGIDNPANKAEQSCLLARKTCPLLMDPEDGYAFTHSVFYATNFGHSDLPSNLDKHDVWEAIEAGILWSLLRFDFDLLGEFMLSALYCQMPSTPILHIGLCALFLTWDENGFVPDRELNYSAASGNAIFYGIYHANLVAALLSSEMMVRNIDDETQMLTLYASTTSRRALAAELLVKLQGFTPGKGLDRKHKYVSAVLLLQNILGSTVTNKLAGVLGDAFLARVYPDLLIGYGLIYKDFEAILTGVQRSLHGNGISPATVCAGEWLMMAMEMLGSGQNSEFSEIIEMKQLLQSLYTNLDDGDDSFI
jgi:hypothetical protein